MNWKTSDLTVYWSIIVSEAEHRFQIGKLLQVHSMKYVILLVDNIFSAIQRGQVEECG